MLDVCGSMVIVPVPMFLILISSPELTPVVGRVIVNVPVHE